MLSETPTARPAHESIRLLIPLVACAFCMSCGGGAVLEDTLFDYDEGEVVSVDPDEDELVEYTTSPYDFTGPTPIADIVALTDVDDFVWQGFEAGQAFPVTGDCEADRRGDQVMAQLSELPATIEGVVTLHPRYFQKHAICGQDERFYGSFFIQDSSGGILVLKDSRVSDFTYGNRVKLRVRALMSNRFGAGFRAVLAYDAQEIVTRDDDANDPLYLQDKFPVYYAPVDGPFEGADIGLVKQVTGYVTREANNNNFSELRLNSEPDGSGTEWLVSLDRELALRNPPLGIGTQVRLTGPVLESFGLRMIIAAYSQIEVLGE